MKTIAINFTKRSALYIGTVSFMALMVAGTMFLTGVGALEMIRIYGL